MGNAVCAQSGLVVEFENGPDDPLFKDANIMPGYSVARWVKVTNASEDIQPIAVEAIEFSPNFGSDPGAVPSDDLSRALMIVISAQGTDLYGGTTGEKTLFQFYEDGETYLSAVDNGDTEEYVFEITFPSEKENEWQGKTTGFDILVGFMGKEGGPVCNYDGQQNNGETGIDCGGGGCPACGGGGGGNGGGGGGGPIPPGLTIQYEDTTCIGSTDAIIHWLTSYKSTSRVIYDTEFGQFDMSETTNYGYAFSTDEEDNTPPISENGVTSHVVTLTGLTPGTTYYFRCVSHASPPTIGKWHEFTTLALGEGEPCCEYPPVEEPPTEEPPADEPNDEIAYTGPADTTTGGITGGTAPDGEEPPVEEGPSEEEPTEAEPTEEDPEANFTAGLGGIFSDLFKDWGAGFPCLPWWLLLILIIYSLVKGRKAWKRINREAVESMRTYWKRAAITWFDWGFLLIALLLIFYFFLHICFTLCIFLILVLITWLIQHLLSRAYKKRRANL